MAAPETSSYFALLIAVSVVGIILAFFVVSLMRQHKKNLVLHRKNIEAEIATLEKERKRMALDLHDEIGPVLSTVKLQINSLDTTLPQDQQLITRAGKYIDDTLVKIREISNGLMPSALTRRGLYAAVAEFAGAINHANGNTHISLTVDGADSPVDKAKEIHLYRIIQEIVHNCLKHSGASVIEVSMARMETMFVLTIKDNGKGFDQKKVAKESDGHGLKNILSRVELLRGMLYLDAEPGKGVSYSIEIPAT